MKWERESDKISSFENIFKRYYGSLVGFFINRGLSRDDSEDLAQETLLRAYRGYDRFQGDASEATWLFIIAKRLWHNDFRDKNAKKRYGEVMPIDTFDSVWNELEALMVEESKSSGERSALAVVLQEERQRVLRIVTQDLPPKMRRSFVLFYFGGLQYEQVAYVLGDKVGTVKSQISQAKVRLSQ